MISRRVKNRNNKLKIVWELPYGGNVNRNVSASQFQEDNQKPK
jgi:hypothetical protein